MSSHHVNQLRDLESKAHFNGVVGPLDGPHPALVPLEKVLEQGVLHLRQGHKLILSWNNEEKKGLTTVLPLQTSFSVTILLLKVDHYNEVSIMI